MSLATSLADHSDLWDRIVAKYAIRQLSLHELVGHGDQHAEFAVKLRQAGFTETIDTEDAFRKALQSLIDNKFLPSAAT